MEKRQDPKQKDDPQAADQGAGDRERDGGGAQPDRRLFLQGPGARGKAKQEPDHAGEEPDDHAQGDAAPPSEGHAQPEPQGHSAQQQRRNLGAQVVLIVLLGGHRLAGRELRGPAYPLAGQRWA